jgi:hypothetical protein
MIKSMYHEWRTYHNGCAIFGGEFNKISDENMNVDGFSGPRKNARFRVFWTDFQEICQNWNPKMDELKSRSLKMSPSLKY